MLLQVQPKAPTSQSADAPAAGKQVPQDVVKTRAEHKLDDIFSDPVDMEDAEVTELSLAHVLE